MFSELFLGMMTDQSFKIEENISNRVRKLKTILNSFTCTLLVEMMDSSESE